MLKNDKKYGINKHLRELLHHKSKKNVRPDDMTKIELSGALFPPSFELCKHCEYNLRCLTGLIISQQHARQENCACYCAYGQINFFHDGYWCLGFNCIRNAITDYGMGEMYKSFTIECLQALKENFPCLNISNKRISDIMNQFEIWRKQGKIMLWIKL